MLRLLRQISLHQLRASWGRTLLVVGGVAVGVTLISAINLLNTSVIANLRRTIDLVAGPASLEVTMGLGEIAFPETTAQDIRTVPGVVSAVPLVRGSVSLADRPSEVLQLYGVDFTAEEDLGRYTITATTGRRDILLGFGDPRSVLVAEKLARELGLGVGDRIALSTPTGVGPFTIRGLLDPQGLSSVFAGRLVVMDLPAAQLALGKGETIDQIDVVLSDDADLAAARRALLAALPPGMRVRRPQQRGEEYDRVLSGFQALLAGLSTLCLIAGMFIVYNTTSTGAAHRALSVATLQHVGGDARMLRRLLLMESLLLGVVGASLGLAGGLVLARWLTAMVVDSMGVIFQIRQEVPQFTVHLWEQATIGVAGISATMAASYLAARRVTRMDPLEVIRADASSLGSSIPSPRLLWWWLALVGISVGALYVQTLTRSVVWGNFGATLWFASSILLALPLVRWSSSLLLGFLPRWFGPSGRVAAESLCRSATRTGITVSAIALVLTIGIFVSTMALSFRRSVNAYFASGFLSADLTVSALSTEGGWLETPISETVAPEIAEVEGVAAVDSLRVLPGQPYRGERIAVAGLSDGLLDLDRYPPNWFIEGDPPVAREKLLRGEGARVSVSFSDRFDVHVGDPIELETPSGILRLEVVDVVPDYMSDRGGVGISRRLLSAWWSDQLVNRVSVFLSAGAELEAVRRRILDRLGSRYRLKVLSLPELLDYHESMITRAFSFTNAIQLLVVIVTIAGIFDLLLSAILERRRELALWRVIGADERTVRRSILFESLTIGILGVALGSVVGVVTAWVWVRINFRYLLGYYLDFHLATGSAVWYATLAIVMAVVAGYAAAREATRQSILKGIHAD